MKKLFFFFGIVLCVILITAQMVAQNKSTKDPILKKASELLKQSQYKNYVPPPVVDLRTIQAKWAAKYKKLHLAKVQSSSFRVNVLPSYDINSPARGNAIINEPLDVWGNVWGGSGSYLYKWDFGDGTTDSNTVSNPRNISVPHTYINAGNYNAVLTVWDANDLATYDQDQAAIRVYTLATQQIRVNMAIEKGLKFLYLSQDPSGYWYENVGSCIMALSENGHYSYNDFDKDIYAETVNLGLQYILSGAYLYSIYGQTYGNPDSNGDGYGVVLNSSTYQHGLDLMGIISGGSKTWAQSTYVAGGALAGWTIYNVVIGAIDQIAFAQSEGYGEGGWRYNIDTPDAGSADNSMTAWITLGLEAAQNLWQVDMTSWPFLKSELLKWLQYSQGPDGGFGYTDPSYWENQAKTGSGIGSYAYLGYSSSSTPVANALSFLDTHWNDNNDGSYPGQFVGNLYAMWGVTKALRISDNRVGLSQVGSHDWYNEYVTYLLDDPTYRQSADGSFPSSVSISSNNALATAFGVLILTQSVGQSLPVAVIDPTGPYPQGTGFKINGARSFHTDPNHHIVSFEWDWDASNGLSWKSGQADATGPQPYNPGYKNAGVYRITLRVTDDNTPPFTNTNTIDVIVNDTVHHPPIAVAGPSNGYNAKVGIPILLDGRHSYSPDSAQGVTIVGYTWDLTSDGVFGDAVTDTTTVIFESAKSAYIYLKVYDSRGDSSTNLAEVKVTAAQNNMIAQTLSVKPTMFALGDQIEMMATTTVDQNSDLSKFDNVTVRFYIGDPFTTGSQIGPDHVISLNKGTIDTIQNIGAVPSVDMGPNQVYVLIDALDRFAEYNKDDNIVSTRVSVVSRNLTWKIDVSASSNGIIDSGLVAGVAILATDSFDSTYDFPKSPKPPNKYVYAYFPHSEWGYVLGPNYFIDVMHDADLTSTDKVWTLCVATDQISKPMSLILTPSGDIPSDYSVLLKDIKIDSLHDIRMNNTYTYNVGTDSVRLFQIIVGGIRPDSRGFNAGWTLMGFPIKANSALKDSVISGGPSTHLFSFSESSGYFKIDTVIRGMGYWLGASSLAKANVVGTSVPDSINIPLNAGFNIISLPFFDSSYSKQALSVTDGITVLSLDSAIAHQWVSSVMYSYQRDNGSYSDEDVLKPWKGYWFASVNNSLQLIFSPPAPEIPVAGPVVSIKKKLNVSVADSNWFVGLTLQTAKSVDQLGGFGMAAGAKSGFDAQYDLPHPPNPPSPDYVFLAFPHPEWGSAVGQNFSADVRAPESRISWKLVAGSSGEATTATLRWDTLMIPPAVSLELTDIGNGGMRIDMKKVKSYQFTINGIDTLQISSILTVVSQQSSMIPKVFSLSQNYPNPFNPTTTIRYDIPERVNVNLVIYDMLGKHMRTLVSEEKQPGSYQVTFDGSQLASGVYFYRITAGKFTDVKKFIMMK